MQTWHVVMQQHGDVCKHSQVRYRLAALYIGSEESISGVSYRRSGKDPV